MHWVGNGMRKKWQISSGPRGNMKPVFGKWSQNYSIYYFKKYLKIKSYKVCSHWFKKTMVHIFPVAHGGSWGEGPFMKCNCIGENSYISVKQGMWNQIQRPSFLARAVLTHMEGINTVPPQIAQIVSEKIGFPGSSIDCQGLNCMIMSLYYCYLF